MIQILQHEPEPTIKKPKNCQSQMPSYCMKTDATTSNQLVLQIAISLCIQYSIKWNQ